ncbi:HAD family hydrolase [Hufsiella ginkgonis]|uniref:HAD hydrolase-like protein n=1 Tax=Hufsiella ginkgonis TaxID=2695274 RepID=A0A7K1Y0Z0_9SPHI|nr:HAD family hydrolase [Hufsiella ginkgonis]MXV16767.1 HAD hydrolase-like protein [Hufsiella ginkgonis]
MYKALIFDLDNTIYPVASVGDKLFAPLFELMEPYRDQIGEEAMAAAETEIMRRPFQKVATASGFPPELLAKGTELLRNLEYNGPMQTYPDYALTREFAHDKFLVTMGFMKLQRSKVRQLGVELDFKEVIIVDPDQSDQTKADVFAGLLEKYGYHHSEVLVIGDDPESEIQAARKLRIDTFLYDPETRYPHAQATHRGEKFGDLQALIKTS